MATGATCAALGASTQIGSTQPLSGGIASVTIASLSAASHTITACYTPSGIFTPSNGSVTQKVDHATPTGAGRLAASPIPPIGQDQPHVVAGNRLIRSGIN